MPVRLAKPKHIIGLPENMNTSKYATSVGLLLYGFQQQQEAGYNSSLFNDGVKGLWNRMCSWFQGNF